MARPGPILKLVGDTAPLRPASNVRHGEVARENHVASIAMNDARWLFATSVAANLEGGRVAMLRPTRRSGLLVRAEELGLRPFDANLVIAIVQDAARDGRALSRETQERLVMVPAASARNSVAPHFLAAASISLVMLYGLMHWITG